ncbi:MAG: AzlC family ABC transporter permease [Syntrophobacteraceae bacterium]|nr:AzlC family ABC transporter permease [Desulfobacteraceae bacterium]
MENCGGSRTAFRDGVKAAWPICLGYVPIGLAFGILAQKAGMHPMAAGAMSLFVYAGSAQFIAVSLLCTGAAATSIILTTLVVNLRHLLMSSSLAVHLQGVGRGFLSLFAYGVTDETFAVNLARFTAGRWHPRQAVVVNLVSGAVWTGSSIAGALGGEFIPAGAFGIDYALSAMFICLLVIQLRAPIHVVTAVISGAAAAVLCLEIPGNSHVIYASLFGATAGFALLKLKKHGRGGGKEKEP